VIKEGFVVCENTFKEGFLNKINGIYDYTFINMDELLKKLLFDTKKEGILKVSLKFNIKPEIAKEYISYLKYIDLFYDCNKLNFLKEIYNYLLNENMIITDYQFKEYLKTKPITIIGYIKSKELDFLFKILDSNGYKYEYISEVPNEYIRRKVYEFFDIEDESRFVFNEIKKLLDNNIPIDNIKIANYNNDYEFIFKRLSSLYRIPINFDSDKNILSVPLVKYLINNLDKFDNFNDLINSIKSKYSNSAYLKNIINIINSYHLFNYKPIETLDLLLMEIKEIKYDKVIYDNGIMLIDLGSPQIKKDDYVFVIGFNQQYIPRVYDNIGYLGDDILFKLNLDTSIDNTIMDETVVINNLNCSYNYIISYKLNSPFDSYLPSSLINKLDYEVIISNKQIGINEKEDNIIIGEALDDYFKYGTINEYLKDNIYDINYDSYNNVFNGISDSNLKKYLPEVIKLSYSAMSNYSKCEFSYLMGNILNLNKYESGLEAYIGSYSHKILELSYSCDDYNKIKEEALKLILETKRRNMHDDNINLSNKELFFLNKSDLILKEVIEFNKFYEKNITNVKNEFEIEIPYFDNKLIFKGFVDKILIEESDKLYITIIDYKTGNDTPSLNNVIYGFNLQLPSYLFMILKSKEFKDPIINGFFLQKIGPNDYPNFKLKGYANSDIDIIKHLDIFDKESSYVDSLKIKNDGSLYDSSRVISDLEMESLTKLVESTIINIYKRIRSGNFNINPKTDGKNDYSCKYCSFKDICHKKEENKVTIEPKDFLKEGN